MIKVTKEQTGKTATELSSGAILIYDPSASTFIVEDFCGGKVRKHLIADSVLDLLYNKAWEE